jgi:hypothetical protein
MKSDHKSSPCHKVTGELKYNNKNSLHKGQWSSSPLSLTSSLIKSALSCPYTKKSAWNVFDKTFHILIWVWWESVRTKMK